MRVSAEKGFSFAKANSFLENNRWKQELKEIVMIKNEKTPAMKTTMNTILIRPGQEPEICPLPNHPMEQVKAIGDLLGGNFASARLFDLGDHKSLHILVNDFAVPLGLKPNRRFPGEDADEIIYGNAIFVVLDDDKTEEGPMDITEEVCQYFIEQLKKNLMPCKGDEKPDPKHEVYVENVGTPEERSFKWVEIEKPAKVDKFIPAGRAKLIEHPKYEVVEINNRYFRREILSAKQGPVQ